MSRIGKQIVGLPSGVTVEVKGGTVHVSGQRGTLSLALVQGISVETDEKGVVVKRQGDDASSRARHGLVRSLIANMVQGVSEGYVKRLEIIGVGYKVQPQGKVLNLQLGFSHPVAFKVPEGIEITQDESNKAVLIIKGIDKQLVGQVAANIRSMRPPEPYKGKGIRYTDEYVRRKPGKAAAAKAAA